MTAEPELSEDEARELITRLVGTTEIALDPFENGWVAREILTQTELDQGRHIGQGIYLIDRTGVVTVHPSLPPTMVIDEYNQARRTGRMTGRRIWPTTPE